MDWFGKAFGAVSGVGCGCLFVIGFALFWFLVMVGCSVNQLSGG